MIALAKTEEQFWPNTDIMRSHSGILGKTGSGKTFAAKSQVESLLDQKKRVCIIDPTGAWYGLRLKKDGKTPAYPLTIFGGSHADIALQDNQGTALGEILGSSDMSCVLDTSDMTVQGRTRMATDFFETIFRKNQGPLYLVIDEADCFMPQGKVISPQAGAMLAAANNLLARGRSRGVVVTLISQRPAKVHKDSLSQVESLITLRLTAPHDKKAVKEWMQGWGEERNLDLDDLSKLPNGTGYVWMPEKDIFRKLKFPMIGTFDSSSGLDQKKVALKKMDTVSIQHKLGEAGKEIIANDPRYLKMEIQKLQKQLKDKTPEESFDKDKFVKEVQSGLQKEMRTQLQNKYDEGFFDGAVKAVHELKKGVVSQIDKDILNITKKEMLKPDLTAHPESVVWYKKETNFSTKPSRASVAIKSTSSKIHTGALSGSDRKILTVLANYPSGKSKRELGLISGYSPSSGSFGTYLSSLKSRGFIEGTQDKFTITGEGAEALGDYEALPTGPELVHYWLGKLSGGQRTIFQTIVDAYPESLSKEQIGERTGLSSKSGTFGTYLSKLRTLDLIQGSSLLKASEVLF